jgi:plastocyanin
VRLRRALALVVAVVAAVAMTGSSIAAAGGGDKPTSAEKPARFPIASDAVPAGAQRLHFEVGPLTVEPGQNSIATSRRIPEPSEDGWIVGMSTNLRRADGTVPPVDVIHLHHGVWVNLSAQNTTSPGPDRFFAAGEEKTTMELPAGYGYPFHATDRWLLVYMLHNQLSQPDQVWMTYDIDFVPASSPAAQGINAARPLWMDVRNPDGYPVFDVLQHSGDNGTFTYPDQAKDPYGSDPPRNQWTVDRDGVLLTTAGHVHPGGLHDDLWLTRKGASAPDGHAKSGARDTAHLFRSVANYFEPAGDVSWDVAMTATPSKWRVAVHKGDVLSITSTYDSKRGSWYEAMGIMVVWMADTGSGADPFHKPVDVSGVLTHGHLGENDQHGGKPAPKSYSDLTKAPSNVMPPGTELPINDFTYTGDLSEASTVPAVVQGGSLVFRNDDASKGIWHTVTACKLPCDRSTGIAYPLANATPRFDSAELGEGGAPAAGVTTWTTPKDLPPGTYTYFCRIHPFMRGVFRVVPKSQ